MVHTALKLEVTVIRTVTPCSVVDMSWHFRGIRHTHLKSRKMQYVGKRTFILNLVTHLPEYSLYGATSQETVKLIEQG